jgi:ABC-type uncharacterized transport system ATPase subunit
MDAFAVKIPDLAAPTTRLSGGKLQHRILTREPSNFRSPKLSDCRACRRFKADVAGL